MNSRALTRNLFTLPRKYALARRVTPASLGLRFAANQVTNKPGSQTVEHAVTNVREEFGNSVADLAKSIAGGTLNAEAVKPGQKSFVSVPAERLSRARSGLLLLDSDNQGHRICCPQAVPRVWSSGCVMISSTARTFLTNAIMQSENTGRWSPIRRGLRDDCLPRPPSRARCSRHDNEHRPRRGAHRARPGSKHPSNLRRRHALLPRRPALGNGVCRPRRPSVQQAPLARRGPRHLGVVNARSAANYGSRRPMGRIHGHVVGRFVGYHARLE